MENNEIIKALECCIKAELNEDCKKLECPFFDYKLDICKYINNEETIYANTLDLINRQQAEIERAKEINEQLYEEMSERQKEEVRVAKKYAVLMFADKLKEKYKYHELCGYKVINGELDDLVKEMVGEE